MDARPEAYLDAIRPGFSLYGGYPSEAAMARAELRCAFRLRARVVRVERLEAGEGVSYHRRWRTPAPTWIATIPLGHVDGYPAGAVRGGEILIGGRLFRVIGTVSASHTVVEIGPDPAVRVGDVATVFGPDEVAIHPNTVAKRSGASEYEMFMHLSPLVPKIVARASRVP
jgi:alanine racemase